MDYAFSLEFSVRDYECDLQGIVNNAVYMNYLEHARHEFLKILDLDFAQMHRDGIDAVVTRIEMDFKQPLSSGDHFVVRSNIGRKGRLRFLFYQDIFKLPDNKLVMNAVVYTACIENGRPSTPEFIIKAIKKKGLPLITGSEK
ncbi:MAG: acyl-CoA thioesterase [Spirochaetales bacterium]|nr:acyl-CoA thioesterase [Spirochaetales bacterium]